MTRFVGFFNYWFRWVGTVGIAGWSLGGGHGPFGNLYGLGVDNVLEIELVGPNGTVMIANSTSNPELFWAMRGGGGSTWGVVTAFTIRAHRLPEPHAKLCLSHVVWQGTACPGDGDGVARLDAAVVSQLIT